MVTQHRKFKRFDSVNKNTYKISRTTLSFESILQEFHMIRKNSAEIINIKYQTISLRSFSLLYSKKRSDRLTDHTAIEVLHYQSGNCLGRNVKKKITPFFPSMLFEISTVKIFLQIFQRQQFNPKK